MALFVLGSAKQANKQEKRGILLGGHESGLAGNQEGIGSGLETESDDSEIGVALAGDSLSGAALSDGFGLGTGPVSTGLTGVVTPHFTVTNRVAVPVPHLVPVPVERNVPVPIPHPIAVPVVRPVPISVPRPVPVPVIRNIPVPVERPIPVPVSHPVAVPVVRPYPIAVPRPYPVPVVRHIPYPVPHAVTIHKPIPIFAHSW